MTECSNGVIELQGRMPRPYPSRRSGANADLPGAIKKVTTRRSGSLTVKVVANRTAPPAVSSTPALKVNVTVSNAFDARVSVSLEGAKPQGRGLPSICSAGSTASATYFGPPLLIAGGAKGSIEIDGFLEAVPFFIGQGSQNSCWVKAKGRFKFVALQAPSWDWKNNGEKPTEGKAADVELSGIDLSIQVRCMSAMELKRTLQLQALQEAAEGEDYDSLRAQVTKARMASVEMDHIAKGEARLKELQSKGLHVNEGCDKDTLRELMSASRVTSKVGAPNVNKPCTVSPDCPCNVEVNPGEVLEFIEDDVQNCLQKDFGSDADKDLYQGLVEAALAVEEGCVWKAGGKLIFSEFNRNQSVIALTRMLVKYGKQRTADMIQKLVVYTESRFGGFVTAIQVNFHPHPGTYHDQHRDIYSQKQSAGPNCTCQFQECSGTICYSLGSSRLVQMDTMTDDLSSIRCCSDNCEGRRELRWLHSGASMYFNGDWNNNHTHGIPPSEEECGPRMSLAFLLAAKAPFVIR
eukprot:TRINITY_DN10877_c0_g1_i1.p1 TRINITY_DN10877_c0_g1~~TRINITY_DN10877_c0_g1_i1.p1  ORF type:complete len:520 (-),score=83.80 TRINITY_DN10877_c0_g1_i1:1756-3315(-)